MSSTIENLQRILEARVDAGKDLAIANPFTALHNQQAALVDMGSEEVTIEMWKGNRKATPLQSRLVGGISRSRNVIRPGVAGANDYLFAYIPQDLELPAGTLNKRIPGESPYVRGTEDQVKNMRRRFHMMNMAIDATRRILTANEELALQSYFDAEMDNADGKLIFPRSASLKNRTVAVSWATAASATPWTDYGLAQRAIRKESQVDGRNTWLSFLSSSAMENLKAIYRSQRAGDSGPNVEFNDFRFNPEQEVPAGFEFLTTNGMEYNGWIRSDDNNSRIHLFTLPEGFDTIADDSGTNYVDWISTETISVGLFSPDYFKAYYGPGILEPPENNVVEAAVGRVGIPALGDLSGLTIGGSGIPANSMLMNIYDLGRNQGFGATLENSPIYAPIRPDVTATIDTLTTA